MLTAVLALSLVQAADAQAIDAQAVDCIAAAERAREQPPTERVFTARKIAWWLERHNAVTVAYPDATFLPRDLPIDFSEALAGILFNLDVTGRAVACVVEESKKILSLDAASCALIMSHLVSQPAVRHGRLMASAVRIGVLWSRPAPASMLPDACRSDGGAVAMSHPSMVPRGVFGQVPPVTGTAIHYRLALSATGMPIGCTVVSATATPELQRRFCTHAMATSRFMPAVDDHGAFVPTVVSHVARFVSQ